MSLQRGPSEKFEQGLGLRLATMFPKTARERPQFSEDLFKVDCHVSQAPWPALAPRTKGHGPQRPGGV